MITVDVENLKDYEIIKKGQYDEYDTVNLVIPSNIRVIEKEAFKGFRKLESLKFEKDSMIEVIDEMAFCGCPELKSVVLPKHLRMIGNAAFMGCRNLQSVILEKNNQLEIIGDEAFLMAGRRSLFINENKQTSFVFYSTFKSLGERAFTQNALFDTFDFSRVIDLKEIPAEAFSHTGCKVIFPTSGCIKKIGDSAFEHWGATIKMPASGVIHIGSRAFHSSSIKEFDFRGVKYIGPSAFAFTELGEIFIPTDCEVDPSAFVCIGNTNKVYRKDLPLLEPYDSSSSDVGSGESIGDKLKGLFGCFKK